jgi:hypothetical protein
LYVVAFFGVGALAYWKGAPAETPLPAGPSEATAVVCIREAAAIANESAAPAAGLAAQAAEPAPAVSRPDPLRIRRQILAWADEDQRDRLQIETTAGSLPGAWKVSVTLRDAPAAEAVQDVNTLAHSYAAAYRTEWKSSMDRAYGEAQAATQRAAEQLHQSQSRLSAILERQVQAAREAAKRPKTPPAAILPPPAPLDNPEWIKLNSELTELQGRRKALLATRTPQHPAVIDVDNRIELVQRRLAPVPRYVPGSAAPAAPVAKVEEPSDAPSIAMPDPAELQSLQRTVEEAGRGHDEAVRTERRAWQARLLEPTVDLQLAVEPPPAPRHGLLHGMALLGAVATGLTLIVGLGMISAAGAIEPPLTTAAALAAAASAPVVGVVPGNAAGDCRENGTVPFSGPVRQHLCRWTLLLLGLLALAGCAAMLWIIHPAG